MMANDEVKVATDYFTENSGIRLKQQFTIIWLPKDVTKRREREMGNGKMETVNFNFPLGNERLWQVNEWREQLQENTINPNFP